MTPMPREAVASNAALTERLEGLGAVLFNRAYELHDLATEPLYAGKPLTALRLDVEWHIPDDWRFGPLDVAYEALAIQLSVDSNHVAPCWRRDPQEVARRQRATRTVAGLTIDGGLDPRNLPTNCFTVFHHLEFSDPNQHFPQTNTSARPKRLGLIAAIGFAQEVIENMEANNQPLVDAGGNLIEPPATEDALTVDWIIQHTDDLPLNGYESTEFLLHYKKYLLDELATLGPRAERADASSSTHARLRTLRASLEDALGWLRVHQLGQQLNS